MKRLLFLTFLLFSICVIAQENQEDCINSSKIIKNEIRSDKSAVVIWEEDFGGGFPVGWSTYTANTGAGNTGSQPGNTAECPWKYSNVGSWGYWNTNQGTSAAPAINSTTAANGFLISDIDSANHWNAGQPSGDTYYFLESYFTTSAIDLTGFPNISLEFEHSFRFNNMPDLTVSVSTDSLNWTTYNVQGNATNNQASADPEYLSLNISPVAGNSPTVYVRVGWTARCYFWMIDDIKIVETLDNYLDLSEVTHGGWYTTPTTNGFGLDYPMVPLSQAEANPFIFEGVVANLGALDQTTHINVEVVNSSDSTVFSTTSGDSLLTPLDTMIFLGQDKFTPLVIDQYNFSTWASSLDTISDTMSGSFEVTENIYARDNNNYSGSRGLGRDCGSMTYGVYYDVYTEAELSSISVYMAPGSEIGSEIVAELYEVDEYSGDRVYITASDDYELTASDTGGVWITLPISYTLLTGTTYMPSITGYASPIYESHIGRSQTAKPTTCYIYDNCGDICGGGLGTWCYTTKVAMIRMNLATISSIEENVFEGKISIYPNPTNGVINLDLTGVNPDDYSVTITNILGEVVYKSLIYTSGVYNDIIDISKLKSSTYILQIENGDHVFTDKIIIK